MTLDRCKIKGCSWHVEGSPRGLCYAHELWRQSLGASVIMMRPVPSADEIFYALRKYGETLRPNGRLENARGG